MIQPPTLNLGRHLLVSGYIQYKFWTLPLMVSSSLLNGLIENIAFFPKVLPDICMER